MSLYWEDGDLRLHQGDTLEVLRAMPGASVDAVVTDPPYSSGTRREAAKGLRKSMTRSVKDDEWFTTDSLTTHGFQWLMRECAVEWGRILVPGGHVLVFIDWRMVAPLSGAIESADLRHIGLLVWNKGRFGMGAYFRNQHELILHFTNGRSRPPQRRDVPNVLTHAPVLGGEHPTEKPVGLMRDLISVVAPRGGVVLDPFAGSGSTLLAARDLGVRAIGIEREIRYLDLVVDRASQLSLIGGAA